MKIQGEREGREGGPEAAERARKGAAWLFGTYPPPKPSKAVCGPFQASAVDSLPNQGGNGIFLKRGTK